MSQTARTALAVGLLFVAPATALAARPKPTGFDPARAEVLAPLPHRVVVMNDRLRSQWAYGGYHIASDFGAQAAINNAVGHAIASGMSTGAAVGAGALGGVIAGAIIEANLRAQASQQVGRADALFAEQGCKLDLGTPLADAVARAVAARPWGAQVLPRRDVVTARQKLDDLVEDTPERQQFTVSYSMTPDYAHLVTTIDVATHAAALKQAKARKDDPAWTDEIVIVSDAMEIADKTPADVEAAVAAEQARHRATGVGALIKAANAGDADARREAVKLTDVNRRNLKEARQPQWTPGDAARKRASLWAADGCAPLRAAADQQVAEAEALLGRLFRGELPARVNAFERNAPAGIAGDPGERVVASRAVGMYLMGRGGSVPQLAYRYSWLPADAK